MKKIKHIKRGSEYTVIGEAEAQVSRNFCDQYPNMGKGRTIMDGMKLTVYQGQDGKLWVRFSDEFAGRFIELQ